MAGGGGGGQPGLILMTGNTGALYHQYNQYSSNAVNTGAKKAKLYGRIISRLFHQGLLYNVLAYSNTIGKNMSKNIYLKGFVVVKQGWWVDEKSSEEIPKLCNAYS